MMLHVFGEVGEIDEVAGGRDAGAGDDVFEFANVSRPGMLQQHRLSPARKARNFFAVSFVVFFQKVLNQQRNVFQPLAERRDANLDRTQAVEKIFPESPGENFGAKVAVRGGDQAHVDLFDFGRPDALDLAILNDAQELGLHGERCFANFVEEHGAAVRVFEQAGSRIGSSGKRTPYMAEQLAFEQRIHQRGTIAYREPLRADRTELVNGARDEFFAGAGLAHDQNVCIVARHLAREIEDLQHRRAFADDAVKFKIFQQLFFERADAPPLVVQRGNDRPARVSSAPGRRVSARNRWRRGGSPQARSPACSAASSRSRARQDRRAGRGPESRIRNGPVSLKSASNNRLRPYVHN